MLTSLSVIFARNIMDRKNAYDKKKHISNGPVYQQKDTPFYEDAEPRLKTLFHNKNISIRKIIRFFLV